MCRNSDGSHARRIGVFQFLNGSDAGQEQGCQPRRLDDFGDRLDPLPIRMGAESVIEAGSVQPVAMRNFDRIDPSFIKRAARLLWYVASPR